MAKTTKSKSKAGIQHGSSVEQAYGTTLKAGLREGLNENLLNDLLGSRKASEEWLTRHPGSSPEFSRALSQWHLFSEMMDLDIPEDDSGADSENTKEGRDQNTGQRAKTRPVSMGSRSFDIVAFAAARAKVQEWETQLEAVAEHVGIPLAQVLASPELSEVWQIAWNETQQQAIDPMTYQSSQTAGSNRATFWYAVQRVNGKLERRYVGNALPPSALGERTMHARRGVVFTRKLRSLLESQGLSVTTTE